jgi:hypothetical protein
MQHDDSTFESYLQEFEPKRPRALGQLPVSQRVWPRRLAAAAAIVLGMEILLWIGREKRDENGLEPFVESASGGPQRGAGASDLRLVPLTRLALSDPKKLDLELANASRNELPNFRRSDSTLQVLAKE